MFYKVSTFNFNLLAYQLLSSYTLYVKSKVYPERITTVYAITKSHGTNKVTGEGELRG